ncbi:hypothetical protein F8388_015871 [Cannabis sativa]|uniref:Uncharacterized protein n=1 Tax=Cannabis sativa TaxID=3483 RepID=A0A7J6FVZ9_CANSA|nr:hypothetical protein F8388_015871 [Cannabis sativa]
MEYTIVVVEIADSPATCPRTLTIIQADFIEAIKPKGFVAEYNQNFVHLLAPLENIAPKVQLGTFFNGLVTSKG